MKAWTATLLGLSLASGGCTGKILSSGSAAAPGGPQACASAAVSLPLTGLARLNARQYQNSAQDLFGQPGLQLKLASVGASASPTITSLEAQDLTDAAAKLVATGGHDRYLSCDVHGGFNDACATDFIQQFGLRVFRRPVEPEELAWLRGVYQSVKSLPGVSPPTTFQDAVDAVAQVMVQSPQHLYLKAFGVADPALSGGLRRTSGYERAALLSYFLLDSTPTEALLQAAAAGTLDTEEGLRAQASTLLETPRGHEVVRRFGAAYAGLEGDALIPPLELVPKDSAKYPSDSPAMRAAMRTELQALYEHAFFGKGGRFNTLMTSTDAYVNGPLAALYGVAGPADASTFQWVNLDARQRAGVFTRAGFLAEEANQDFESPIHRGVTLYRDVLCQALGPPPPNANNNQPPLAGDGQGGAVLSVRAQTDLRTAAPMCQGCHGRINAFGNTLNDYDAMGQWQTADVGVTAGGTPFSVPVDSSVTLPTTDLAGPMHGGVELSQKLAASAQAQACMAQRWFVQAAARPVAPEDACTLEGLRSRFFASKGDMRQLVVDVAASAPLLYVRVTP